VQNALSHETAPSSTPCSEIEPNRRIASADPGLARAGTHELLQVSNENVASRWPLRWVVRLLVVSLCLASVLFVYAFVVRQTAKSILRDVYALRVGVSSTVEVQRLMALHRHALLERHCETGKCLTEFEVYNTWLYRLKLEPVARFFVDVEERDGTVNYIMVSLSRDTRVFPTSPSGGIIEEYERVPNRMLKFSKPPYWFPTPVGKPYLSVALTSEASPVERQHAYALSLACLIMPGEGCDLPCYYLPLAWRDWQGELEKQGFGAEGFGPYYPTRARCK